MSGEGWIKLYRQSVASQAFQSPELWKLWTLCLLKANHQESWVMVPGITEPIKVFPGQFITGRYSLHKDYYPSGKSSWLYKSPLSVWRWLQKLENMGNLNIKTNNKYSIITIINWGAYQSDQIKNEQVNEQQMNNRRTTDEQQMNTNKNDKECLRMTKKKNSFVDTSDEVRLSKLLFELILERNPNHKKPNIQAWTRDIDLMIRRDKRAPAEIERVIKWTQQDEFWQNNILSTSKLRKQYDQLILKMPALPKPRRYF